MPWFALIWVVIFIIRMLWRSGDNAGPHDDTHNLASTGKVIGHKGPHMRAFSGRAGRREWWLISIWSWTLGAMIGAIPVVGPLLSAPWIISGLAVNARRLHDLRRSAWLQLIPVVFAAICMGAYIGYRYITTHGVFGPELFPNDNVTVLAVGAISASYFLCYGIMGLVPGKGGPNAYGEADPA